MKEKLIEENLIKENLIKEIMVLLYKCDDNLLEIVKHLLILQVH